MEIGKFYRLYLKRGRAEILSITELSPNVGRLHMPFILCFGVTHDFCTLFIYLNKVDIAGNFLNIFLYFKISMKLQLSVSPAACP